jgi:hypothetical protein
LNIITNELKKWRDRIYWSLVDHVEIDVKWPEQKMVIGKYGDPGWYDVGANYVEFETSDPNYHYRPFMEQWIGRQGWDWDWRLAWHGRNIETGEQNGRLTIRMRQKHAIYASHMALMWN